MKKDVNVSLVQGGKLTRGGWLTIVSFLLVAVLALSVALGLVVKSHKEEKPAEEVSASGGMVLPEVQEENGISLVSMEIPRSEYAAYDIMPTALSGQTVKATVKDTSGNTPAELQYVTFELKWKSSNSATLADYVTMSTTDTTATLTCLKAFSMQIVLTVKAVADPTKTASVTLDYAKSLTGYKMKAATKLFAGNSPESSFSSVAVTEGASVSFHMPNATTKTFTPTNSGAWCYTYFYFPSDEVTWGEGTVENSIQSLSVALKYSDAFLRGYSGFTNANSLTVSSNVGAFSMSETCDLILWNVLFKMAAGGGTDSTGIVTQYLGSSATATARSIYDFVSSLSSAENPIEATLTISLQYGSVDYHFYLDPEVEPVNVKSVEVGKSDIVFFE